MSHRHVSSCNGHLTESLMSGLPDVGSMQYSLPNKSGPVSWTGKAYPWVRQSCQMAAEPGKAGSGVCTIVPSGCS